MFRTKRPTPTTVLYTVSTRPSTTTLTTRFLALISLLLRILTGLVILTTALYSYKTSTLPSVTLFNTLSDILLKPSPALHLLSATTWPSRLAFCAAATYLTLRRPQITESLLVIRGLGVQTSTSAPLYLGAARTRFIPTSSIQDIFIHEAFKGFEVKFYLGIVVEGEEDVVVVFPKTLPRREVLEEVWRGARACLYEPKT